MKVTLAGFNVDVEMLQAAHSKVTPETLCAAYARISRDPRSIGDLRREAIRHVGKARRTNKTIVFDYGHATIAEHAVFNFDIEGISRLAIEELERFRLCSYTEKSQRYVTLDNDFYMPEGLPKVFERQLKDLIYSQGKLYDGFFSRLKEQLKAENPESWSSRTARQGLEGQAKEDARYVTMLLTTGQVGLTANARNLGLMIRRFRASQLEELQGLADCLYTLVNEVAPSLFKHSKATRFDLETRRDILDWWKKYYVSPDETSYGTIGWADGQPSVYLVSSDVMPTLRIAASLLHSTTSMPFSDCWAMLECVSYDELTDLFRCAMEKMELHDATLREFEHASFTFEIGLSASAYAQLKRHRMSTQTPQDYSLELGLTLPESFRKAGLVKDFSEHIQRVEQVYSDLRDSEFYYLKDYVLTNAHRRRVLVTMNLRELYHFSRMREDKHAQWEIRALAHKMSDLVRSKAPLAAVLLGGKSQFDRSFSGVFDAFQKVGTDEDNK
jgi:flavin-dependent thymidylate synthase